LSIEFNRNLNEDNTFLVFSEHELGKLVCMNHRLMRRCSKGSLAFCSSFKGGLTDSYLNGLEKTAEGKYKVTLEYPSYYPLMKRCHNPETRRKMETAFHSRCKQAAKRVLQCMPYSIASVQQEYSSVIVKKLNSPIGIKERKYILALKKRECLMKGYQFDGQINAWDLPYYMNQVEQCKFAVNKDKLIEYFPLEVVTEGLFGIYQELLGLAFEEVECAHVWHEDVKLYSVRDTETEEEIGQFYLDLHPRASANVLSFSLGLMNLRQVVLSRVDQYLHSCPGADTAEVFAQHCQDILGVPATPGQLYYRQLDC
ncbi:hypothetical protein XENOCAPTIV_020251, partial [Xenoophorus captivus]